MPEQMSSACVLEHRQRCEDCAKAKHRWCEYHWLQYSWAKRREQRASREAEYVAAGAGETELIQCAVDWALQEARRRKPTDSPAGPGTQEADRS